MSGDKNICIIGNGRIAKECAMILNNFPSVSLTCVIIDGSRTNISPDLKKYCEVQDLDHIVSGDINSHEVLEFLNTKKVDLIFSINNHQIFRDRLLHFAPDGIINFHNGPLPRYGGLNACSWAIFNGETRHGVTWHYVTSGVDEGDIVAQKLFDIDSEATALQLIMTCINEGINLFKRVIADVLAGTVKRMPQDSSERLYYHAREVPCGGIIDFSHDYKSIQRLVRALNFNPLASPLGHAAVVFMGQKFYVDKVKRARHLQEGINGEVIRADNVLEIQAKGSILEVQEARDEQTKRLPVKELIERYAIKSGMRFNKEIA